MREFLRLWWFGFIICISMIFVGILFYLGKIVLEFLIGWLPVSAQQIIGVVLYVSLYPAVLFLAYEEIKKKLMGFIT
jgi:hypothetical protein